MSDDELLDLLGSALADDVPPVDAGRLADLRAAAEARRAAAAGSTPAAAAAGSAPAVAAVADAAPVVPIDRATRRAPRWFAAAAAAAVIAIAGVAVYTVVDNGSPGVVEYAGPITGAAGEGELTVVMTGIGRVIDLDTTALPILPKSEYYEVWFVGPGDSPESPNRISAGTFHPDPDGRSEVTFAAAVDPALYPQVEITAEPGDGDPAPSGIVVLDVDLGT